MARSHRERLQKKYGEADTNQQLLARILSQATQKIANAVGRISKANFERTEQRLRRKAESRMILPDVSEALPKRSVFVRKARERGQFLSENLRRQLSIDLRRSLREFRTASGQPAFLRRAGAQAGTINPEVIRRFEANIRNTLASYTRKDKRYGVPVNVHTISVTEMRSTVNLIKQEYAKRFVQLNPGRVEMSKRWIHNRRLSNQPRPNHMALDRTVVPFDQPFEVAPGVRMMHPHDPSGPLGEIVNCNCDFEVLVRRIPQTARPD